MHVDLTNDLEPSHARQSTQSWDSADFSDLDYDDDEEDMFNIETIAEPKSQNSESTVDLTGNDEFDDPDSELHRDPAERSFGILQGTGISSMGVYRGNTCFKGLVSYKYILCDVVFPIFPVTMEGSRLYTTDWVEHEVVNLDEDESQRLKIINRSGQTVIQYYVVLQMGYLERQYTSLFNSLLMLDLVRYRWVILKGDIHLCLIHCLCWTLCVTDGLS